MSNGRCEWSAARPSTRTTLWNASCLTSRRCSMLVMILEKLPRKWRGALSRWLIELKPGMFLGNPSQRIRDELWRKITDRPPLGYVLQLWSSRHPQGYEYRQYGESKRMFSDF